MKQLFSLAETADLLGKSKETLRRWDREGKLIARREPISNYRVYQKEQLKVFDEAQLALNGQWDTETPAVPLREYAVLELFAGAGGFAVGLEKAGLKCAALNEIDHWAAETLRRNRAHWNVLEGDIKNFSFAEYEGKIDVVTGGFPCQAFSYAGKKLGLNDARGTLFYEFARTVNEVKPLICIGENVRGLLTHDGGRTLRGMISILDEIGYRVIEPKLLKAILPQRPTEA